MAKIMCRYFKLNGYYLVTNNKDMKRLARGYTNFNFLRNRILWAERKDAHILGSPIPIKDIKEKYKTKKKRGPYKKHK